MHFTRLRLLGFKSFVDPTEFIIEPGLTGVVGPNGCGKSNLLEAIRWVMGENRPTAMRGAGMEDVIFAGSADRPARGHAEVSLTLDNSDRLAPASFNDQDRIEIMRRITREAGSVFRANGKELRARDVQMLFADASTGAHSPSLVRQGQIGELISARPKARRRILEEAAGISGLYQRRHEAELKLHATETNLTRVQDVLDQLDQQIAALARQARQAARYRDIAAALRRAEQVALYILWQEARTGLIETQEALQTALRMAARAETAALATEREREAVEARLPALREEETVAGAVLQRVTIEIAQNDDASTRAEEAIRTLAGRVEELARDATREEALTRDARETTERLHWEDEALEKASEGHEAARSEADAKATAAAAALSDAEQANDRLAAEIARLQERREANARRLSDAQAALTRLETACQETQTALQDLDRRQESAQTARLAASEALAAARDQASMCETALSDADAARSAAQAQDAEARAQHASASAAAKTLETEVGELDRLLTADRPGADGVLGRITVTPGYEAALGAALGDDLHAAIADAPAQEGWHVLPALAPVPLPAGVEPLSQHVDAPDALARRIGQVGVVSDEAGAALWPQLKPGQRLVSRAGWLWRWDGLQAASRDAGAAAALRLQQQNRRAALAGDLSDAREAARMAQAALETAKTELGRLIEIEKAARNARMAADSAVSDATRALNTAEAEETRLASRRDTLAQALAQHRKDRAAAGDALGQAQAALEGDETLDGLRQDQETTRQDVAEARRSMLAARADADELRRAGEARTRRRREIAQELEKWARRADTALQRQADLDQRRGAAVAELKAARQQPDLLSANRARLDAARRAAQTRRRAAADALAAGEAALRDAQNAARDAARIAGEAREARARSEAVAEASEARVAEAAERISEETQATPEALAEAIGLDAGALPSRDACEIEVARLLRQREAMGAVNLRAEQDREDISAEHAALSSEKSDLEAAITKLRLGIAELNREGRQRLLAAFEEVNRNFSALFRHLFGGGEANLVLVESEDPLDAGLEIMCMPPGKKLSTLSLLSGGEQTLTAISLIFAVFIAKPSPICVLDEVDAPLDDANVSRFCDLLDEMARRTETRFLIITHHALTMSRLDRLYGVTMAERGVSQLVSVDLNRAAELVDGG